MPLDMAAATVGDGSGVDAGEALLSSLCSYLQNLPGGEKERWGKERGGGGKWERGENLGEGRGTDAKI